ncbi:MAG: DUF5668 domain-containing protein [Bacteroidota bacterium]|nr:DUF5668 domain-containing protein [Bacteroidota bacterium]
METIDSHPRRNRNTRRTWGVIVILLGGLLMANQFNLIHFRLWNVVWSWQMLLIVIGLVSVVNNESKFVGIVLIAIGSFFMIDDFWYFPQELRKAFWPAVVILFGAYLLISPPKYFKPRRKKGLDEDDRDFIDEVSIFGGGDRIVTSSQFKGGRITSIFGGSKINLMNSGLSEGKNVIDTFCVFGGTTIIVPAGWTVKVEVVSIFGGFSDKRERMPNLVFDQGKTLIIKGVAIFGGGEVKSFGM